MSWLEEFSKRKPLSKKQILAELKKLSGGESKCGFCHNSRRWCLLMIFNKPETCTYPNAFKGCSGCGYFELREPTIYLLRRLQELKWGTDKE